MLARGEWERLLAAVVQIYEGEARATGAERDRRGPIDSGCFELLDEDQRELVAAMNVALARIVELVRARSDAPEPPPAVRVGALGGAEMVARAEILAGRSDVLPDLLPTFAYLATLPFLDAQEARRLCTEAEAIVASSAWRGPGATEPGDAPRQDA